MNEKNKQKQEIREKEDATKYGEFISSYFAWVSLPEQKNIVDKLENITEKKVTVKSLPQEGVAEIDYGEIIKEIKVSSKWSGNRNDEVTITFNNNLSIQYILNSSWTVKYFTMGSNQI